jgi:hypothetical protein
MGHCCRAGFVVVRKKWCWFRLLDIIKKLSQCSCVP